MSFNEIHRTTYRDSDTIIRSDLPCGPAVFVPISCVPVRSDVVCGQIRRPGSSKDAFGWFFFPCKSIGTRPVRRFWVVLYKIQIQLETLEKHVVGEKSTGSGSRYLPEFDLFNNITRDRESFVRSPRVRPYKTYALL